MTRVLDYLRQHAIAVTALVCSVLALAGSSYAAFTVPNGSVGEAQIQNHVIDPVKFDRRFIAGYVRAWVRLQWRGGKLVATASSSPVHVAAGNDAESIIWPHRRFATTCMASATPQVNVKPTVQPEGWVTAQFTANSTDGASLLLFGFTPSLEAPIVG